MAIMARSQITLSTISDGEGLSISIKGGVRGISYAADGSNPNPSTSTEFTVELTKNGMDVVPFSYFWTCGGNLSGESNEQFFTPKISSSFISGNSFVSIEIRETEGAVPVAQTVPIVSTKFADGLDWIMDWDKTGTMVNEHKVITPRIFAGKNDGTNLSPNLNGVAIGLDILGTTDDSIGIVGYNKNDPRFKLDIDGNFFVGSGWGDISSGIGGGLKYDAIEKLLVVSGRMEIIGGTIGQKDVDKILSELDETSTKVESWSDPNEKTTINGGSIATGTVTANKLNVKGLTVRNDNGDTTFSIAQNGDVSIDGTLQSKNFTLLGSGAGYRITPNGDAILNQAMIRGTVQLPFAGLTDEGTSPKSVRIWAGDSYDNREYAPFKVFQDGSLEAYDGTFSGKIYGDYDNNRVHIRRDSFYIDNNPITFSPSKRGIVRRVEMEENKSPFILFSDKQSVINTDLYFGTEKDKDFEYIQRAKTLSLKTKTTMSKNNGSVVLNYDDESNYIVGRLSNKAGGRHEIRYEGDRGELFIESSGTNDNTDIVIQRPIGDIAVDIKGRVDVNTAITSKKHNIEMRMTSTGFAFYVL